MPPQIHEEALPMTKKTTRTRAEAKRLMWEYYQENKSLLPNHIKALREDIISNLMDGFSPSHVFYIVMTPSSD
jgi:hypothetical protein